MYPNPNPNPNPVVGCLVKKGLQKRGHGYPTTPLWLHLCRKSRPVMAQLNSSAVFFFAIVFDKNIPA